MLKAQNPKLDDLFKLCIDIGMGRFVKTEQTATHHYLILCGMLRVSKHLKTGKVTRQRLKLCPEKEDNPLTWVRTTQQFPMPLFYCNGKDYRHLFTSIADIAVTFILNDLKQCGINGFSGVTEIRYYEPIGPDGMDGYEYYKKQPHDYNFKQYKCHEIAKKITNRLCFIPLHDFTHAAKSLTKHTWSFVDKAMVSVYLSAFQIKHDGLSFFDLEAKHLEKLKQQRIDTTLWLDNKLLLPLMNLIPSHHYANHDLFRYKVLLSLLHEQDVNVTKGDLRLLQRLPVSLIKEIVKTYGDVQQFHRDKPRNDMTIFIQRFLRINALIGAPVWVRGELVEMGIQHTPKIRAIFIGEWATYHRSMVGRVKALKQKSQWQRALNQLSHVFDWYDRNHTHDNPIQIHKNQRWPSFMHLADEWVQRLRDQETQDIQDCVWSPAWMDTLPVNIKNADLIVNELCSAEALQREGNELEHCVFSYRFDCQNNRYRVFSLRLMQQGKEIERATLGLDMDTITQRCHYDQLRAVCNDVASNVLHTASKHIINAINKNKALAA